MTRDDDARVADLIGRLGDGDTKDLFRRLLERGLQDLVDAELTTAIGAGPHERTDSRVNQRNGARTRLLSTPAGDIELADPEGAGGVVLPEPARTAPAGRSGFVSGDHDRVRDRDLDAQGRRLGPGTGL
jgi:putative transposase